MCGLTQGDTQRERYLIWFQLKTHGASTADMRENLPQQDLHMCRGKHIGAHITSPQTYEIVVVALSSIILEEEQQADDKKRLVNYILDLVHD